MLKYSKAFLNLLLFLTSSALSAQELSVKLIEELVIGDDESKPKEYLFSVPEHISTDSRHHIYVADYNSIKIRVFDENGVFIKRIGQRGQGPGEILEVTSMVVDQNDDLLVADRMNRRITRFSLSGEYMTSYPIPEEQPVAPWQICPLGAEGYASKYISRNPQNDHLQDGIDLVHIFDKNFKSIQASIARSSDIWDFSEPFEKAFADAPNSIFIQTLASDKILVVPHFYKGVIYLYRKTNKGWIQEKLQGKRPNSKPYTVLDKFPRSREERPARTWAIGSKYGKFIVLMNSVSRGLFTLNSGMIVHFSFMPGAKNKWFYGVELFDAEGKYIGYGHVKNIKPFRADEELFDLMTMWKDGKNRFYNYDARSGFSVIRRVRLEYKIKDK